MFNNNSGRQSVHDAEEVLNHLDGGGGGGNSSESDANMEEEESEVQDSGAELDELQAQLNELLAESKHNKEHENAQIDLVDNSEGAVWCKDGNFLTVTKSTVFGNKRGHCTIRSTRGFTTLPMDGYSDVIIYNVHYYEVAINEIQKNLGSVRFGLADGNFPTKGIIGREAPPFSVGLHCSGRLGITGKAETEFSDGFAENDVVGCGVMVTQKTKNGEAVNCEQCEKQQRVVFFTKNGKLCGTPIPLSTGVPDMLYPTVSLGSEDQVTGNFNRKPFKFAIPPARGLIACGHCCQCKQFA